jgi:predicted deacetylase
MIYTVDDLCMEYLSNFKLFDEIKAEYKDFKLIAFTIGNFKGENLAENTEFKKWYDKRENWVEIAVHSYEHCGLPDGDRADEWYWIETALDSLRIFLPKEYGYRSPGWQTTNKTEGILRELGFSYIAYESMIKYFDGRIVRDVINSHLYDRNSIRRLYEICKK